LVNLALFEHESCESFINQSLVEKTIDLTPPLVNRTIPVESEPQTTQDLLVSSISNELEVNLLLPEVHERISHIPIEQEVKSHVPTTPPLSSLVTSFDWSRLTGYRFPSYVPFHIALQAYHMAILGTVIDEGASVSIMSSTAR